MKVIINDPKQKIADAVIQNHFLIIVLERFGIQLGLQEKTIEGICEENSINTDIFFTIQNLHINANKIPKLELNENDVKVIIRYLKNSHEYYKTEILPNISKQINEIVKKNNDVTSSLIKTFFDEYKQEVLNHLEYEDSIVFPYVIDLVSNKQTKTKYKIKKYKINHNDIETKLNDLKNLLIKHLPVKDDQKLRRNMLYNLFRFEKDLSIHTIIEEDILVPAIEKFETIA